MRLREHLIIGGAASVFIYFYFDWALWEAALFFASSVLIDADHYWDYLWRNKFKDWSGWRMFRYWDLVDVDPHNPNLLLFALLHTAETLVAVFLLAEYWHYAFFIIVFWGMIFHIFFDMIWFGSKKAIFTRANSVIEYLIRKRLMIKRGLDPDGLYKKSFEKSKYPA